MIKENLLTVEDSDEQRVRKEREMREEYKE